MFFFFVSLCIEGVDLNTDPQVLSAADGCLPLHRGSGFKLLCILQEMVINSVSLCIEGVDLNNIVVDLVDLVESLPLHRGSGFKLICVPNACHFTSLPLHRGSGFKLSSCHTDCSYRPVSLCIEGVDLNFHDRKNLFEKSQSPSA